MAVITFWGLLVLLLAYSIVTSPPARSEIPGALAICAFMAVMVTGAVRLGWRGLYLGEEGIRLRGFLGSRTIPWAEIASVGEAPAEFLGLQAVERVIWITLHDGTRIEAPVQRRPGRFYLRPVPTWRGGPVLRPADFDNALTRINEQLTAHRITNG